MKPWRVLFVCTGNICRSPTAHGVLRALAEREGLAGAIEVDSVGTHDTHAGEPPDERSQAHARRRGYDLSAQRARLLRAEDLERFDLILAMDAGHLRLLRAMAGKAQLPKLKMAMDYAPAFGAREVPDPYYGGAGGFERVLDMAEASAAGLLHALRTRTPAGAGKD